ncbi:hypothetical protein IX92_26925 (plasmid) [Vibrio coralliilyticus]|uniref:Uncharacterized protein n=1 Tax=Vibrio coralliilyticus TaxID=190893 RepID=A0AAN0SK44_9VIBR|nr:hypothetical protein IX92_26925 [Vibrio coralliilyticus]
MQNNLNKTLRIYNDLKMETKDMPKLQTVTECAACLGAPFGQCFECFCFAQTELDETENEA